jgi:lipopolysaccharide exporter
VGEISHQPESDPPLNPPKKGSFAGDVIKLVSGTSFAQLITVLAAPLLTRLYSPADFGVLAVFISTTDLLGVIACLSYEQAIVLPEEEKNAVNLFGLSLLIASCISLLSIPFLLASQQIFTVVLKMPEILPYLWLLPFSILATGAFYAFNYWNTRTRKFGRLAIRRVINSLLAVLIQLGFALAGWRTAGGLILGYFGGVLISTTILGLEIWRDDKRLFLGNLQWAVMIENLKRYRKFPMFTTWSTLLNVTSWQLPSYMLPAYFSKTVSGYYALGNRVLRLPMGLIGGTIGQAFFPRAARAKDNGTLDIVVENVFNRLVAFSLFPLLVIAIAGEDIFVIAFGAPWAEAGVYSQILSIWTFFWFISAPMSQLFNVLEKQEYNLAINMAIFITRFIALTLGGLLGNARLTIVFFTISGILTYGFQSFYIIHSAGVKWNRVFKILGEKFSYFLPAGALLVITKLVFDNPWATVIVAVLSAGIYYYFIIRSDEIIVATIARNPAGRKLLNLVHIPFPHAIG